MDHTHGIKVGDIVTAYYNGYYRVTKIERRFYTEEDIIRYPLNPAKVGDEYNALIHGEAVLNRKLCPVKRHKEMICDAAYCEVMTAEHIQNELGDIKERYSRLLALIGT